jgi:glycosyltransferase involved in cell wall biosynthesis
VGNTLSLQSSNATQIKRRLSPYLVRWFYPWADAIVAISQGVAEDLSSLTGLPLERIQVIYNPVVTPKLLEKATEKIAHPWFAPGEPPIILGVGRLTKQKDFPTLIRAFALVRQRYPARLMILGKGEERLSLETLVQRLGLEEEVFFCGFVQNPYSYMAQASVFVLSSAWEGFGNVLVEAMAVGTPVVSTDCKSGPAEILAKGKYGELVAVGDEKGLARAIARTLKQPQNSERLKARSSKFSVEAIADQYLQVLFNGNK